LTFGGYWAWDPVENASLVPWLVLVAGLHTQVIYNATGHSLRATFLFLMLSFILILYSTFLTRSGVLGDTSVHAFVDSGMNLQLLLFIFVFLIPATILFTKRYKNIPHIIKEENTWSREFWMFIGSLVLFLSALFVIISTSLPVINGLSGSKLTVGDDASFAYNRIEIFIAIILGVLTAATQYLKYKNTAKEYLFKKIAVPTGVALGIAAIISLFGGIHFDKYGAGFLTAIHLAVFGAVYAVVANAGYIWSGLQGKMKAAGASVAHLGFGLMLLGILLSSSKKEVLSYNTTGINLPFDPKMNENPLENITLLKNVKTDMGKYWATYVSNDSINETGNIRYFHINMEKKDGSEGFELYPNYIKVTKGEEGYSRNPDKHHYWNRDIFAYINYADLGQGKDGDTTQFKSYPLAMHDTAYYSKGYIVLDKVTVNPDNDKYHFTASDTALMAELTVYSKDSMRYNATPLLYVRNNEAHYVIDTVFAQNLALSLGKVIDSKKIELRVKESSNMVPFVSLKVYEFPQINLLWIGILIMITGFIMSMVRRVKTLLPIAG
jgi:cytochrome c-type biogenesis protein CcmF